MDARAAGASTATTVVDVAGSGAEPATVTGTRAVEAGAVEIGAGTRLVERAGSTGVRGDASALVAVPWVLGGLVVIGAVVVLGGLVVIGAAVVVGVVEDVVDDGMTGAVVDVSGDSGELAPGPIGVRRPVSDPAAADRSTAADSSEIRSVVGDRSAWDDVVPQATPTRVRTIARAARRGQGLGSTRSPHCGLARATVVGTSGEGTHVARCRIWTG